MAHSVTSQREAMRATHYTTPELARRFRVTPQMIRVWAGRPDLNFPRPVRTPDLPYRWRWWARDEIARWEAWMKEKGVDPRRNVVRRLAA